jgi:hypothetical protein
MVPPDFPIESQEMYMSSYFSPTQNPSMASHPTGSTNPSPHLCLLFPLLAPPPTPLVPQQAKCTSGSGVLKLLFLVPGPFSLHMLIPCFFIYVSTQSCPFKEASPSFPMDWFVYPGPSWIPSWQNRANHVIKWQGLFIYWINEWL